MIGGDAVTSRNAVRESAPGIPPGSIPNRSASGVGGRGTAEIRVATTHTVASCDEWPEGPVERPVTDLAYPRQVPGSPSPGDDTWGRSWGTLVLRT